jgi:2-keto-4-pentenoate hydratase/2-oxohepta-3-ene-1,7-dioic acid hydratase in catechol pathway
MRFVRVRAGAETRWGLLLDDSVRLLDGPPWLGGVPGTQTLRLSDVRLLAPVEPSKILGVGTNYRAHAVEMGKPIPDEPLLFMKPPTAVVGPDAPIVRPRGWERVDFEGELGVVIGRTARRVPADKALDYVFGYTVVNDVTVRDLQKKDGQFTRAKGFDSFCPCGPSVVTHIDARDLGITTRQNGQLRQDSRTSDLIFDIAAIVACASRVMTLLPGDLIATGTPSGVGPVAPGDEISIEIQEIGTLTNPVVDEDSL